MYLLFDYVAIVQPRENVENCVFKEENRKEESCVKAVSKLSKEKCGGEKGSSATHISVQLHSFISHISYHYVVSKIH